MNMTVFHCKTIFGIQFGNRCNNCVIKKNGNEIQWQKSVKHLGNIIDQKLSDVEDCRFKRSILIGNVNKFIGIYSTLKGIREAKMNLYRISDSLKKNIFSCS